MGVIDEYANGGLIGSVGHMTLRTEECILNTILECIRPDHDHSDNASAEAEN
ncbi:hypothetical protein [Nocardia asiatica]|uniref:hypothetical protein n=1 Tax=Nocardia asiatica TaxID=209252 RepID=UPI0024557C47|nr:hypothetical protein [Nocardia asiatica]